jgi:hypothetical protein
MDRCDSLPQLLTDDDVETLKQLAREGTGENTCGLRVGSRLSGDLGGNRHRPAAVVAGDGGAPVDARRRRRKLASGGLLRCEGPYARDTVKRRLASWSTTAPVEGDRGTVRCAEPAFGPGAWPFAPRRGHASVRASGPSLGCLGSVDRDPRDGSSSRYPGSRDRSLGVRVRRAPAQRSGAPARRAAEG